MFLRTLHALAFLVAFSVWTWALLVENPVPEKLRGELGIDWEFILGKCLHGGAYAFLTVLGGLWPKSRRGQWFVIGLLAFHGMLTEILQATMELGRHGCVRDVLVDWAGIVVGIVVLRLICKFFKPSTVPAR